MSDKIDLADILVDFENRWIAKDGVLRDFCPRQGVDLLLLYARGARRELSEAQAMVKELAATLCRVRDEMEASGGWDGDEDVFSDVVAAVAKAETLA